MSDVAGVEDAERGRLGIAWIEHPEYVSNPVLKRYTESHFPGQFVNNKKMKQMDIFNTDVDDGYGLRIMVSTILY